MKKFVCFVLAALLPATVLPAETVTIPFGTTVFCELDQRITSRQKDPDAVQPGDLVRAHVWKDVRIDGRVVIEAGTSVFTRVSTMKKARMAGRKGILELEVLNVAAIDQHDVPLDGGYDKSGKGKMGLTIALAAVVAWPLVFLKGKNAFLEPGVIFDAIVRSPTAVEIEDGAAPRVFVLDPGLNVTIPYDAMDPSKKIKELPLIIDIAEGALSKASIVSVNGQSINPIQVAILGQNEQGKYNASVDFKVLSGHFTQGMNRFEVEVGEAKKEVLLEIEF